MTSNKKTITGVVLALAIAVIGAHEGLRLNAYPDPVTKGAPWTICYGETLGISKGDKRTVEQCKAMLRQAIEKRYGPGLDSCIKNTAALSDKTYVAFLSLEYNIGQGAFCKSSIVRHVNAGNLRAACDAILLYNKAGGKVIPGLVKRRNEERKLCLSGL